MTLELYDGASCGERLTVRKLSLGRSPGVFAPLLFGCKPHVLINNSSASISTRSGAFLTVAQSTVVHESEIVLHTSQEVVVADPMSLHASRVMFAQVFLGFSNLSPCCERRKVVAESEHF